MAPRLKAFDHIDYFGPVAPFPKPDEVDGRLHAERMNRAAVREQKRLDLLAPQAHQPYQPEAKAVRHHRLD